MDIKQIEEEIISCISIMDVPMSRKSINKNNIQWMRRNLGIKNSTHPLFEKAMKYMRLWISSDIIRKENCN